MQSVLMQTNERPNPIALDPAFSYNAADGGGNKGVGGGNALYYRIQSQLSAYITTGFAVAKEHRAQKGVDDRLIACLRSYKGEYDPLTLAHIEQMGGTRVFRRLTTEKCEDLGSWLKDVLSPTEDQPWDIQPTPLANLPPEVTQMIIEQVGAAAENEFYAMQMAGVMLTESQLRDWAFNAAKRMRENLLKSQADEAKDRAAAMTRTIKDQQKDGGWHAAFRAFIDDFKIYPNAFIRGPFLQTKRMLQWAGTRAIVQDVPVLCWKRIDPANIFPSPNATSVQDGELYERDSYTRRQLESLINQPGFNNAAIREVLSESTKNRLPYVHSDIERAELLLLPYKHEFNRDDTYEAVWFNGDVRGTWLTEIGIQVDDPQRDYSVCALWVAGHVIKAIVNPDPLGHRPYSSCSFRTMPGSFWGQALPECMEDIQKSACAAIRSIVNNMAMSSGPIQSVDINAIAAGQEPQKLGPWMLHEYDGSKLQGAQKALEFHEIPSNAKEYLLVYDKLKKEADDITGIPAFVRGSGETEGAGETARGLAMLMDSAAKGIREIVSNISSDVIIPRVEDQYTWNMLYNPDEGIKGDCQVVVRGPLAVIAKHQAQISAGNLLAETNNPIDMSIIGVDGRAKLLRKRVKLLDFADDDVVPPQDVIEKRLQQQALAQAQAQAGVGQQEVDANNQAQPGDRQ
ncbi:MAG: hypothetical protein EOM20_10505 [Spartobacteria bacterium]|nr:hypothetical protein [Spartobacteria bacterium]